MSSSRTSRTVSRVAGLAVTTALAAAGVFVAGSAPAQASSVCSGTQVDSASMTDIHGSGAVGGTLYLYYNSSTGRNCAYATNATGARHSMIVWVSRCAPGTGQEWYNCQDSDSLTQGSDYDAGNYISYAGPVNTLGSAAKVCVEAYGEIDYGNVIATADLGGHCG
ncbi:MAG TPA: hypothetical protein VFN97_16055 [Actinospica sp.]|nr:hypothetical protein [Actinospica sp.]